MKRRPPSDFRASYGPAAIAATAVAALFLATAALSVGSTGCGSSVARSSGGQRVIVLGFDGTDYDITRQLMAEGRLPNFKRLADMGTFRSLETSVPPQSPVAWSNFITGMDPGGHGIYDFIHRDPKTMIPFLSTSRTEPSGNILNLGKYCLPLKSGGTVLLREGRAFWEELEDNGIETTVIRMPANYPPSGKATRELSGMGTPDVLGTYGTFSFYTSDPLAFSGENISGGEVFHVSVKDHVINAKLHGPSNELLCKDPKPKLEAEFTVYLDPDRPAAKLVVGDEEVLLEEGEWSGWLPVSFPLMPTQSLAAEARFRLVQVRPDFELYVSPLNIDPLSPAQAISTPDGYAAELAEATGRFYTQGMPEDTKALTEGVFGPREFLSQAELAELENFEQYKYVLDQFDSGLLFYYFGNADQVAHVMWRPMDPGHPIYDAEEDAEFADVVFERYDTLDEIVGYTLDAIDENTTLIVMSDHGFTSWRRSFHLNSWLKENGFLNQFESFGKKRKGMFPGVDWSKTKAYGLGLNGLYINLRGRERNGVVDPSQRAAVMDEIAEKLLATIDPQTGQPAVTKVYKREEVYRDGAFPDVAPDLVVGYAKGTRGSNESALGEIPEEIIVNNEEPWSGDHCMDHETVPGILLTSRPLQKEATSLKNLASAVVAEFGIEGFPSRN